MGGNKYHYGTYIYYPGFIKYFCGFGVAKRYLLSGIWYAERRESGKGNAVEKPAQVFVVYSSCMYGSE